ncbi:MAG: DnaJ domain-containing protein [Euryarchaeota archaeon]|nr:DnaJ domain-containing protein [Euryarchaeota archaeon]
MTEELVRLWLFIISVLFLLAGIQTVKYLFWWFRLKREKKEREKRLRSDRTYPIFQRKPNLVFDILYDTSAVLRIKNRESSPIRNVRMNVTFLQESISFVRDALPGVTEIPLNIEIPPGSCELNASFTYLYGSQRYTDTVTRMMPSEPPAKPHEKDIKEIKSEYRALVKKYHPDLAETEEERRQFESKLEKINKKYGRLLKK